MPEYEMIHTRFIEAESIEELLGFPAPLPRPHIIEVYEVVGDKRTRVWKAQPRERSKTQWESL
jgi:hypothetical protein